jgi:hypothetical protein
MPPASVRWGTQSWFVSGSDRVSKEEHLHREDWRFLDSAPSVLRSE